MARTLTLATMFVSIHFVTFFVSIQLFLGYCNVVVDEHWIDDPFRLKRRGTARHS